MQPRSKTPMLIVVMMVLAALVPALAPSVAAGEDRQGDDPLGTEDAMVRYAILTSSSFEDQFGRLAEWKTEKGVYAKVYATDWVTAHYQGRDSRAQYHAFLRDLYNHTGGELEYLLIGGDHEIVRAREIWAGPKPEWRPYSGDWLYSDHYYAGLDHDWDANGNDRYGEVGEDDWDAEIAVGRAPVSTGTEATEVVDKLLAYELNPEVGDWMRRAVLVSTTMNPPNANVSNAHDPDHIYKWWEDNAWESIERTIPLIPVHMDQHILYDYDQIYGGNYTPANDTLDRASYTAAMDMGSSIFVSVTHGWIPTGNGIPHYVGDGIGYNWSTAFYHTDIPNLQNGNMTPFAYFSSCYVGNFTELNDSNFEKLFTMRYGGTIGFVAPTENTYRGEENPGSSDGNWWMSETFWRHLLREDQRPGDALYQMIREYVPHLREVGANPDSPFFRQNHAAYNLVGDPEMPIWLDRPKTLTVLLPDEIYDLEYDVPVKVTEGPVPLEGARVCFRGEDFYSFADTNETGWATLHISPEMEGQSVTITVTRPQYLPYQRTEGVTPAPAELLVVPHTIRAATDRPQAGRATTLSAEVRNIGHTDALSFSVQFYDGDPGAGGTAIGTPVDIPGLPADKAATVTANWASPQAGYHDIFVMVDSGGVIDEPLEENNLGSNRIFVSAVNARAEGIEVEGAGGSTALPVNVRSDIVVHVSSTGSEALDPVPVRLYLGDPGAGGVPVGQARSTPSIPGGGQAAVTFPYTPAQVGTFRLFAVVDPGDELMEFDETDNEAELPVKVGHPPAWSQIPDAQMVEDSDKTIELGRYLTDYDNQLVELEVSVLSISTNRADASVLALTLTIEPHRDWSGQFSIELVADDGDFEAVTSINVIVDPRNDPPVFNKTGDYLFTIVEGQTFFHKVDVYDPDGDPVFLTDNSELFDVSADGVLEFNPTYADVTRSPIHAFRVIASDGVAQSYLAITFVMEAMNTAPTLTLPERLYLAEGKSFSYAIPAHDREGDALTFTDDTDLFDVIATTGQFALTPTGGMVGEHNVTITVSDGEHTVTGYLILWIYSETSEERQAENLSWLILAGEIALIIVGLLFLFNLRRRQLKDAAEREAAAREGA